MSVTLAVDAIGANTGAIPRGMQAAGYSTGSGVVPWSEAMWAAHPGAVRICQDPFLSDHTADVADVESGAGTTAAVAGWAKGALASWEGGNRPGQRRPAVYASASNVTAVVNALNGGGVHSGVGLWIANWNLTEAQAAADAAAGAGPFPVIGVQYHSAGALDYDVFSTAWLQDVSGKPEPPQATGPFRHVVAAGNTRSLWRVCTDRNMPDESSVIALSRANLTPARLAAFNAYVAYENAAHAAGMLRPAMGEGLVYFTANE